MSQIGILKIIAFDQLKRQHVILFFFLFDFLLFDSFFQNWL